MFVHVRARGREKINSDVSMCHNALVANGLRRFLSVMKCP